MQLKNYLMQQKKLIQVFSRYLPVIFLGFFAFFINYYYGFIGLMPMDNTVLYNGGYKVLNGFIPFKDYWLVTGPLLDYLNAMFFLFLDVSWQSFIIHSSAINLFLAVSSYFLFISLKIKKNYSLLYSALICLLFYPVVGTPFVDHHATFFLILAFYFFISAINNSNNIYFLFIPLCFCLSFLSKQTPAAYGIIVFLPLIFLYCFFKKDSFKQIIFNSFLGSLISLAFIFIFFYIASIDFKLFYKQYIQFASSIGNYRFANYNFNLLNVIEKYKFINFFIIILTISIIKLWFGKDKNIKKIFNVLIAISLALILIFHQYYTLNQNYIFFIIPFLCAIFHSVNDRIFNKNYVLIFCVLICVFSVTKYHLRFNEHRKFNELEKVNLDKAVNAGQLGDQLKGLKWITYRYPENPQKEIENLLNVKKILSLDNSKKVIITDYQFLASLLNTHDYSPNQWHHPSVSFPLEDNKYFNDYKFFFINSLKDNKIDFIYETVEKNKTITELILNNECYSKTKINDMLIKLKINKSCHDFK